MSLLCGAYVLGNEALFYEEDLMNNVIPFDYNGQFVRFTTDGWINATDIARRHGKRLDHWLENAETKRYMAALAEHLNTPDSGYLIKTKRGRSGGTWLHPKMAVAFTRWIDVDFGVWADIHIDAVIRGSGNALQEYERAHNALETRKEQASAQGQGLAQWRHQKQPLQKQVEYWREQLQLPLNLKRETA